MKCPGSYTGLRIGVSAAKGIAFAKNIPLLAVNTLQAMCSALADGDRQTLLIPMIDARRMEVYSAGYDGSGRQVFRTRAEVLDEGSFPEAEGFKMVKYFGDGAEKCRALLDPKGFQFIDDQFASARGMAALANGKFLENDIVDTAYFEPFYLKDFVAGKKKG